MKRTALLALVAAAFAVSYAGVMWEILEAWTKSYAYSYGFIVLLVSVYVCWSQFARKPIVQRAPDYLFGIPVVVAGIAMLAAGRLSLLVSLQEASFVVTLAGLILVFAGREVFARVSFPLGYLLLGIPIWDAVITRLQPPSQLLSARMALNLLQIVGVPVLRDGTRLVLPNVVLEVMRECSGVNQLLAIITLALPAAYLTLNSTARRLCLLGLAVVDAYLSNGVRIAMVGVLAYRGLGDGDLRSLHLAEGLAVSIVGYVFLFGILSFLARGERKKSASGRVAKEVPPADVTVPLVDLVRRRSLLDGVVVLAVFGVGVWQLSFRPEAVPLPTGLQMFPRTVGDWTFDARPGGFPARFPAIDDELVHAYPSPAGERHFAAVDDELVRVYRNSANHSLSLYIGYYQSQLEGKELVSEAGHALNSVAATVTVPSESGHVDIGEIRQDLRRGSRGLLYWYDVDGHASKSLYLAKKYLVLNSLTSGHTNGAVVMVGWESRDPNDGDAPRQAAIAFARTVLGLLPRFIPS